MNRAQRSILLFVLIGLLAFHQLAGQTSEVSKRGTTAAAFLAIPQGARALGMGGAFVAVANDPTAMYWNPAGIAGSEGISVLVDHSYWIADIQYDFIGATIGLGSIGTLGVNLTASDIGEMKVTTVEEEDGTGETFEVTDIAFGVSYGIHLTQDFSIGFNPKFIYQKIWKMSASGFAIDMGVKYRTPFPGFTLGMSISNFGTKMQMTGTNSIVLYDSDIYSSGNDGRVPANLATEEWELPLNFRVGIAYNVPAGELGTLTLVVDATHPSDNYESVDLGGEFVFQDFICLRAGYKSLFQRNAEENVTAGLGIKQFVLGNMQFHVDYSYMDFSRLKNAQKITLGVSF